MAGLSDCFDVLLGELVLRTPPIAAGVIPGSIIISVCALGKHSRSVKMHG